VAHHVRNVTLFHVARISQVDEGIADRLGSVECQHRYVASWFGALYTMGCECTNVRLEYLDRFRVTYQVKGHHDIAARAEEIAATPPRRPETSFHGHLNQTPQRAVTSYTYVSMCV
jgi:hypothetical protein